MIIDVRLSKKPFNSRAMREFLKANLPESGNSVLIEGMIDVFGDEVDSVRLRTCLQKSSQSLGIRISAKSKGDGFLVFRVS